MNAAQQLFTVGGQSLWYDNISKELLDNGSLKRYVEEWGVRGLTSNPTIFEKAIGGSSDYDLSIARLATGQQTGHQIDRLVEDLMVEDIAVAADLLMPVYLASNSEDGYVSIEVSPLLARDAHGTVEEAKRIYDRLSRRNVMIKVPGTPEGLKAVKELLALGINVNITLLFSVENYIQVAETYIEALEQRMQKGLPIDRVRSVASFFVSRVDTLIDGELDKIAAKEVGSERGKEAIDLKGKFGVANSRLAYQAFERLFYSPRFEVLKSKGALVQRPLWASTGTKNPKYRDVLYVEQLIGKHTVNTMPHNTLEAFIDHGVVAETIKNDMAEAEGLATRLEGLGIDLNSVFQELQRDGVQKFIDSFVSLKSTLEKKVNNL